ncbi:MAG: NADPH-dependent FMN reductase [Polyangiales bacterium]
MPKLHVVIASTRPGRAGEPIGKWFFEVAKRHAKFDVTLVDLVEVGLPLLDEPHHPRLQKYTKEHTKKWSAIVREADAYAFVTPEYNYGSPASLINALDFVYHEWAYKPASFVSYGGVSGGLRSVQMTKQKVTALRMMPIPEAVTVPMFSQHLKDGVFSPPELQEKAANTMLDELLKWSTALSTLR